MTVRSGLGLKPVIPHILKRKFQIRKPIKIHQTYKCSEYLLSYKS